MLSLSNKYCWIYQFYCTFLILKDSLVGEICEHIPFSLPNPINRNQYSLIQMSNQNHFRDLHDATLNIPLSWNWETVIVGGCVKEFPLVLVVSGYGTTPGNSSSQLMSHFSTFVSFGLGCEEINTKLISHVRKYRVVINYIRVPVSPRPPHASTTVYYNNI